MFIAGLAILLQPFLCVRYSPAVAGSYFDSPIVQRSKVDPPFSMPSLFFSLPPVLSGIYSSASRLARLFILISTRNVGRRGKDDDAAAFLQEREFLPSFFLLFLFFPPSPSLSFSLLLSPRRKSMRHDRRSCKILERKMLLYTLMRTRIELFRGEGGKKSCRSCPGTTMYGSWRAGKIALDSSSRRWTIARRCNFPRGSQTPTEGDVEFLNTEIHRYDLACKFSSNSVNRFLFFFFFFSLKPNDLYFQGKYTFYFDGLKIECATRFKNLIILFSLSRAYLSKRSIDKLKIIFNLRNLPIFEYRHSN